MAIAYNSTSISNQDAASASTLTWAHTCNALDTKLVVACGGRDSISGVTYNGVAMTLAVSQNTSYEYNATYYLDAPATGASYNIVVTYASANTYRMGAAVGISGCANGIGATGQAMDFYVATTPVTATANITTTIANSDILALLWANYTGDANTTYGGSQIAIVANSAGASFRLQYKNTTTAGANSVSISNSTPTNVAAMAIEIMLPSNNGAGFFNFM